jgi:tripartite-type tricarboxylate transporter receptor subunit TctC
MPLPQILHPGRRRLLLAAAAAAAWPALARAQAPAWPTRPVRFIVPYAPGGPTDTLARVVGAELGRRWGQQVVVDNRPGANAVVGAALAAQAPADGHTLFQGTASTHGINPHVYRKLPYDPVRDFAPVVPLSESALYLAVANRLPVQSAAELLAYVRQRPGAVSFGSLGPGSTHQIAGELLQQVAGVRMLEVPYKGTGPASQALMAGEIDVLFDAAAVQHARAGKVRILGVTSRQRWPITPDIPTLVEQGLPEWDLPNGWFAIFVPAGVPPEVVARINRDTNEVLRLPEVRARLAGFGHVPTGGTPEALRDKVQSALAVGERVARTLKLNLALER